MKVVAGIIGAVVGVVIVAVVAMTLIPRLRGNAATAPGGTPAEASSANAGPPKPDQRINAPKTREEELREELARKRVPFFRYLRQNFADQIDHSSVLDDYDTLDLVVKKTDDQTLTALLQNAVAPSAREYGFRRVRWYVRNPVGSADAFTIVAESSYDEGGRWNTFRK